MYNLQGVRFNQNLKNRYNNNSSLPLWKKNLTLSSEKNELYNNDKSKISLKQKLPYLFSHLGSQIMNSPFNLYQYNNLNPNKYYIQNYKTAKIAMGLPMVIPKAKKYKEKYFTPELTKINFSTVKTIKKNAPNLVVSSIIQETINTPPNIKSIEKPEKKSIKEKQNKKIKLKDSQLEKFMKRSKTEDNIEKSIKPFLTTEMKFNSNKKWWNLLRYFTEIYYFFSVLRKYTQKLKEIRAKEIKQMEENLIEDIHKVRNWMLDLQGNFWINLLKYKSINASFEEQDSIDIIYQKSKILIQLIDNILYNLKAQTNDIEKIPTEVQNIIYRYIKKNSYFPSKYLNIFHIKRLVFDFHGSCLNNTFEESGMLLSYFLISSILVQQIFLNIKFIFKKLKPYENIVINMKYVASLMCYLQRDAFINKIKINNDYLNLFNYYRCYREKNILIEKEEDINTLLGKHKKSSINLKDDDINNDIYNKILIDDKIIEKIFAINYKKMKKISNSIFVWSVDLAKLILNKFDK